MTQRECMHSPELISRHEEVLTKLTTTMTDFIARSIDDRHECQARYERDRVESLQFRADVRIRMEAMEKFIEGLKPDHKILMVLAMGIILGALSLVWKLLWGHIAITKGGG